MDALWPRIEPLLARVQKPARYIGCEDGAVAPAHSPAKVAWLLTYPDTYEIGLPNQGLQILYEILNERDDAVAERAYAPWTDLEALLRQHGVPLFSVDTHRAAGDFDVLAFNVSAELVYTNVLNCIDLAGIPLHADRRRPEDPLVVAGGHCTYNPEPLADFVDLFVIGDGEEVVSEVNAVIRDWKSGGRTAGSRERVLRTLAGVPGVYVPSMYDVEYDGERLAGVTPKHPDVPERVEKRTIADLGVWPYPKHQLVPLTEVVHDRLNVEVFRGCTRGCRFCQAGMITRPVRERPAEQVRSMVREGLKRTGYDEVALTSLSTADFSGIEKVVADTVRDPGNCGQVSVSLPSLRVDAFTVGIAAEIQRARRTGLTFVPEAGTWRMRQVINKLIREEDLYGAVESAFSQGWSRVKLYFMTGLPTETDEDTLGIAHLARTCAEIGRSHTKRASITASVGGFVPKPFTPFQWYGQTPEPELRRRMYLLRDDLRRERGVSFKWHDPKATLAEGIASRGDRRLGAVIEHVWRRGGTFQEWSEHFDLDLWLEGMAANGLSVDWYVHRDRDPDEVLPWDHLSAGLHKDFLWQDWQDVLAEAGVEDCRWTPCYDCGACTDHALEHVVASATPPAGGSQGTGQDLASGGSVPVQILTRQAGAGGPLMRVRLRYDKRGKIRFLGHRDVARLWERVLRRAELPVAYTEGFSPRPRLSFGLALSTGYESDAEYLDVDLEDDRAAGLDVAALPSRLGPLLPVGIGCTGAAPVGPGADSLQEAVTSCAWRIEVVGAPIEAVTAAVAAALAAPTLEVTRSRKGREAVDDIRPAVLAVAVLAPTPAGVLLDAELGVHPRSVRPSELVGALGAGLEEGLVTRTHQWISRSGARREPLDAAAPDDATQRPHAEARAS